MKQDIIKIRRKPPWQVAVKEIRFLILPAFSVITAAFRHSEENPLPAKGQISKEIAFCSAKQGGIIMSGAFETGIYRNVFAECGLPEDCLLYTSPSPRDRG